MGQQETGGKEPNSDQESEAHMKIKPTKGTGGVTVELGARESQMPAGREAAGNPAPSLFSIQRILVPMDFSECSKKALQYAIPFAEQFDAKLILVNVVEPFIPMPEMTTVDVGLLDTRLQEQARRQLATLEAEAGDDLAIESVVRMGNAHVEIVNAAKELDADLIIVATHGRTGLAHMLLGSTAERVAQHADCPVLIVREREHDFTKPRIPLHSPPR